MRHINTNTGEQLVNALHILGVKFIMGGKDSGASPYKQPARLIAALAESKEARLRLSLIPLFFEYPEFATVVRRVAGRLDPSARLTLQCYYSAAVWLQQKYHLSLDALIGEKISLPDYFSFELGMQPTSDPEINLVRLAQRHQTLSKTSVNWLGTYKHAAQVWLKGLELQKA